VQNSSRFGRTLSGALAALGVAMAVLTTTSGAQATIPKPLKYQDSDGAGIILISEFAPDPATGGQKIQVQLTQNGKTYSGIGFQLRVHEDPPNVSDRAFIDLIVFTIRDSFGRAFQFRGRLQTGGIVGKLIGSGSYQQAGVGGDIDQWTITE
jgi:hypothetical protein